LKSIVLLSGGLDSVVNLKVAADRGEVVLALTFDYGQQAFPNEAQAASTCAALVAVPHRVIELNWYKHLLPEPMTGREGFARWSKSDEIGSDDALREAWIPNRNGVFINIGAAFAEFLGADSIVMGLNREEGQVFPDNSRDFLEAANRALAYSTLRQIELVSYTVDLTKAEIVRLGMEIGAPIDHIYSCYQRSSTHRMCGTCQSCVRLKESLEANGILERLKARFVE